MSCVREDVFKDQKVIMSVMINCKNCRKIMFMPENTGIDFDNTPFWCRDCMIKNHGRAWVEHAENTARDPEEYLRETT